MKRRVKHVNYYVTVPQSNGLPCMICGMPMEFHIISITCSILAAGEFEHKGWQAFPLHSDRNLRSFFVISHRVTHAGSFSIVNNIFHTQRNLLRYKPRNLTF